MKMRSLNETIRSQFQAVAMKKKIQRLKRAGYSEEQISEILKKKA